MEIPGSTEARQMADAGRNDWILRHVTSRPSGDDRVIAITDQDFETGGLQMASVARPGELFTAQAFLTAEVGRLRANAFERIRQGVVSMFE